MADEWNELCRPPADARSEASWRQRLESWRHDVRAAVGYDGSAYEAPELAWARTCFVCGMVMLWDEAVCPRGAPRPTALDLLSQGEARFGGFDAVVLWHAYPRIGFDDRDQFDFYREVPGGLAGLSELVGECHARGVRALLAYYPWDVGTRREPAGAPGALVELVAAVGADGIFLDTLAQASTALRRHIHQGAIKVALMTEGTVPLDQVADHPMSWAQWPPQSGRPHILRNKWLEPRHMELLVRRWHRDHTNELHLAWLNGAGVVVWENVFGSLNPWSTADASLLRKMRPVQRALGDVFARGHWEPLVATSHPGLHASRWASGGLRLWAVANMTSEPVGGDLLPVERLPGDPGAGGLGAGDLYWDLFAGAAAATRPSGGRTVLTGEIEAHGIAAFAAGGEGQQLRLAPLLRPARPSALVGPRPRAAVAVTPAPRPEPAGEAPPAPAGASRVPLMRALGAFQGELTVQYRLRECGLDGPAPLDDAVAPVLHEVVTERRPATLSPYRIDLGPVTNEDYLAFLEASRYRPERGQNFLRHWPTPGAPAPEALAWPVVFVDLDDARAYARWAGKRLPTPYEWQHAVGAGGVGYGLARVWELTDGTGFDGHNRYCVLKGGSGFRAEGSEWYADGGPCPPEWWAKFISLGPSLDRCATIGFRCAAGAGEDQGPPSARNRARRPPSAREVTP